MKPLRTRTVTPALLAILFTSGCAGEYRQIIVSNETADHIHITLDGERRILLDPYDFVILRSSVHNGTFTARSCSPQSAQRSSQDRYDPDAPPASSEYGTHQ